MNRSTLESGLYKSMGTNKRTLFSKMENCIYFEPLYPLDYQGDFPISDSWEMHKFPEDVR